VYAVLDAVAGGNGSQRAMIRAENAEQAALSQVLKSLMPLADADAGNNDSDEKGDVQPCSMQTVSYSAPSTSSSCALVRPSSGCCVENRKRSAHAHA
jgi:hypothetical protein